MARFAHPELLARTPEPMAILYGAVDEQDYTHQIVLGKPEPPREIREVLER